MKYLIIIAILCIFSQSSQAAFGYAVSVLNRTSIDPNLPTHILISGDGQSAGDLFQNSAASKGQKYFEVDSRIQVVLISINIEQYAQQTQSKLSFWNYSVSKYSASYLNKQMLLSELLPFSKIVSVDVYSHAWTDGLYLSGGFSIYNNDRDWAVLATHFAENAFAMFYGCNTGWFTAPFFSDIWRIPVAGTLTSANFEQLHSTNDFYPNDDYLKPSGEWSRLNSISFASPRPCEKSGCLRMKADNIPYDGLHGQLDQGLPFSKFFCRGTNEIKCKKAMALSMSGFLGTRRIQGLGSFEDYKYNVQEILCPIDYRNSIRSECRRALVEAELSGDEDYTPFQGHSLQCDFLNCVKSSASIKSTTFVREYKNYLQGYRLLQSP